MDEFERLEEELSAHYHYYLQNHRNLAYLESELEKIEFAEQARARDPDHACNVTTHTVSPAPPSHSPLECVPFLRRRRWTRTIGNSR